MSTTSAPLVLTATSPDRAGLVAAVAGAVAGAGGNILDVGQHSDPDADFFGCRIEVDPAVDRAGLVANLDELRQRMGLDSELHDDTERARVVLCCSRSLHCAADLLARVAIGELSCEVVAIVSDHEDARDLADRHGVAFVHLPVGPDRSEQEARLGAAVRELSPDLVVLARYMRILPAWLTEEHAGAMINIHHSFLPAFAGARPYARAHDRGVKLIGATAHYVTAELDAGPIIAQDVARVSHRDSVADLVRRGADVERAVLAAAVRLHLEHRVMVFGNRTCVFD
jgi:formyltetrahydrofolate deformylase